MGNGRRPQQILAWRPVLLFGGGLALAVFEAVQPLLGHPVEWAIVSLSATMMGLEFFRQAREPDPTPPSGDGPAGKGGPAPGASPGNPARPGSPAGPAALAALAALVSRKALAAAVVVAASAGPAAPRWAWTAG
jgi:hypothetical protein